MRELPWERGMKNSQIGRVALGYTCKQYQKFADLDQHSTTLVFHMSEAWWHLSAGHD